MLPKKKPLDGILPSMGRPFQKYNKPRIRAADRRLERDDAWGRDRPTTSVANGGDAWRQLHLQSPRTDQIMLAAHVSAGITIPMHQQIIAHMDDDIWHTISRRIKLTVSAARSLCQLQVAICAIRS
jgi:hypothetical protein